MLAAPDGHGLRTTGRPRGLPDFRTGHRMISTRAHGAIDYSGAAVLARLSLSRGLTGGTCRRLAAASVFHAGYSLATDYEAGVRPFLTMTQHLALDAAAGAGLVLAALRGRHLPVIERAMLAGIGLAELAVVARSSTVALAGAEDGHWFGRMLGWGGDRAVAYAPVDTPKAVAPGVHIVDAELDGAKARCSTKPRARWCSPIW